MTHREPYTTDFRPPRVSGAPTIARPPAYMAPRAEAHTPPAGTTTCPYPNVGQGKLFYVLDGGYGLQFPLHPDGPAPFILWQGFWLSAYGAHHRRAPSPE